jgi:hypothetical protein
MVLLCNTFITETRPTIGKGFVFRENLKSFNNFDIFKYSLASLAAAYPWRQALLFIELDPIYEHRRQELYDFIDKEFNGVPRMMADKRNYYQSEWKATYDMLDDDLIWFYCNHDHIFIDSSQDYLKTLVEEMRKEKLCSLAFSHWPECIRSAKNGGTAKPFNPNSYKIHENYISVENESIDSIQIITKDLYKAWWFDGDFNHIKLPRPDYFGIGLPEIKPVPIHKVIIPLKELCRHFDGYQHCTPPILNDQCPAIEIPEGFFESNIKIAYGINGGEGWTTLNPLLNYKAVDYDGADYKWILDDIPLFWKKRIKNTYIAKDIDNDLMMEFRMKAVMDMVNTHPSFTIDGEVIEKIYKLYLSNTEYSI